MAIDWNDWKPPWRAPPISRFEPKKPPPLSENIVLEERADQIDEARLPLWRRIFLGLFLGGAIATLFSPVDPPKEPEISRPVPVVRLDARAAACLNVTFKAPFYVASRNAQPSPMCVRPRRFEWLADTWHFIDKPKKFGGKNYREENDDGDVHRGPEGKPSSKTAVAKRLLENRPSE